MQELLSFEIWEIVGLILLFLLLLAQLYFYIVYYKKPYTIAQLRNKIQENKVLENEQSLPMVSVIISSENEVIRLSKNLPVILEQDYPNFEVIIINNSSTDETDELIDSFKVKYKNLYTTYIPYSNDKDFGRRKLAFTLGAKAARGNILLFIEPHSTPISNQWIRLMTRNIRNEKEVTLGLSYYSDGKSFFSRISRFDNHIFQTQFASKALLENPYTGSYTNLAFKKDLFFENKGFASHLALENGEDVFMNQIVNSENTYVALEQDSFTESVVDNFALWKRIKKNYSIAKSNFKDCTSCIFSVEIVTRILFYLITLGLIVYSFIVQNWVLLGLSFLFFILRLITQLIIINNSSKYFNSGKFYWSLILLDILQPVYNMFFRTRNKRSKRLRKLSSFS